MTKNVWTMNEAARRLLPLSAIALALAANAQQQEGCKFPVCPEVVGEVVPQVVGGCPVKHERFPWQVAVFPGDSLCGGSLIDADWVLTAAHCVDESELSGMQTMPASAVHVVHGASDLRRAQAASHRRVANIYPHPRYNGNVAYGNDIALLRLSEPIAGARASYANLLPTAEAARKFIVSGACAVVSGYGMTSSGQASPVLQAAALPIVDQRICSRIYGSKISAGNICAGFRQGGIGSCYGDSGGPLVVEGLGGEDSYVLAGVVSWGVKSCVDPGRPGVYARVSHYMPWIMPTMRVGKRFRDCAECPEMVVIPAGSFMMGSPNERPEHQVEIGEPLAVGVYEVTREEYGAFVSETGYAGGTSCRVYTGGEWREREGTGWRNPGYSQTRRDPVACVSWKDAQEYVTWLRGKTGEEYRLLSEAEWEYAVRAGTQTRYSFGDEITESDANYGGNMGKTQPVGSYGANGFGLYDMHGNVWEWVQDCWNDNYRGAPSNGDAWESGNCSHRVLRGGSWDSYPRDLRTANRFWGGTGDRSDDHGFRVAQTLAP